MFFTKDSFAVFNEKIGSFNKPLFLVSITMIFGALVAGATSEGGAAIAFPVLTLTMGVSPPIARDFSYLIQSVGMTSAAFSILFMGVKIERNSLLWCSIGGVGGLAFGLEYVAPNLTPPFNKMYFVCIWLAFAFSLYWVNMLKDIRKVDAIEHWDDGKIWSRSIEINGNYRELSINSKALTLLGFGIIGGIFTSMSGSGLDICSFAVLTLLYRVDERVATPTSVILMGINTVVAYFYRVVVMQNFNSEAYKMLLVAAPIVCIMAPVGSILATHFHSDVLAGLIYIVDIVQFIGALAIIQPWLHKDNGGKTEEPLLLCWSSSAILILGAAFFTALAKYGVRLQAQYAQCDTANVEEGVDDKMSLELAQIVSDTATKNDDSDLEGNLN